MMNNAIGPIVCYLVHQCRQNKTRFRLNPLNNQCQVIKLGSSFPSPSRWCLSISLSSRFGRPGATWFIQTQLRSQSGLRTTGIGTTRRSQNTNRRESLENTAPQAEKSESAGRVREKKLLISRSLKRQVRVMISVLFLLIIYVLNRVKDGENIKVDLTVLLCFFVFDSNQDLHCQLCFKLHVCMFQKKNAFSSKLSFLSFLRELE